MTIRIARLGWGEPLPTPEQALSCGLDHWLIPLRWACDGGVEFAVHPAALLERLPGCVFSLEWQLPQRLSPRQEQQLLGPLRSWLFHAQALRIASRPVLWIYDPQELSHPLFVQQRLRLGLDPHLLLVAAGPPETADFEAVYERSDRIPCQQFSDQGFNYESFLFHAHHRPVGQADLVVPCVTAAPNGVARHLTALNYREWLALSSAWSGLRHQEPSRQLVLIEAWAPHQQMGEAEVGSVPSAFPSPSSERNQPRCQAISWGTTNGKNPALLIHGYHLDLLDQGLAPLAAAHPGVDLYVSTPLKQLAEAETLLRGQGWTTLQLVGCPNRGRDQAPFWLELLPRALRAGHPWVVKLHTKRSAQTPGGEAWGRQLWQQLASPQGLKYLREAFSSDNQLQVVVPEGSLLPTTVCLARNERQMASLCDRAQINARWLLSRRFAAGSFWAARTTALISFEDWELGWESFEPEQGQVDGTLAHALERLMPAAVERSGGRVLQLKADEPVRQPRYGHPWAKAVLDRPL